MTKQANKLKSMEQFKLMTLVKDEFTQHNVTDGDFAAYAESTLGFKVTAANVMGCREALGIPSTRAMLAQAKTLDMSELEKRIAACEKAIEELGLVTERLKGPLLIKSSPDHKIEAGGLAALVKSGLNVGGN